MINAKDELIRHIGNREVKYVYISKRDSWGYPDQVTIAGTLEEVLPLLDFYYDNGYGGQILYGNIWYTDGTWSERGEYDGSEWWAYKCCPEIPNKEEV